MQRDVAPQFQRRDWKAYCCHDPMCGESRRIHSPGRAPNLSVIGKFAPIDAAWGDGGHAFIRTNQSACIERVRRLITKQLGIGTRTPHPLPVCDKVPHADDFGPELGNHLNTEEAICKAIRLHPYGSPYGTMVNSTMAERHSASRCTGRPRDIHVAPDSLPLRTPSI